MMTNEEKDEIILQLLDDITGDGEWAWSVAWLLDLAEKLVNSGWRREC